MLPYCWRVFSARSDDVVALLTSIENIVCFLQQFPYAEIIETRTRKNARDANGKLRAEVNAYDVRYNYRDPATGQIVRKKKRGFLRRLDAEEFLLQINKAQQEGVFLPPGEAHPIHIFDRMARQLCQGKCQSQYICPI